MSKQFRSFHEFIQPSDLDYECWLEELPRGAVKNSDMPKGKELQISSLIGPSNLGSPEEDSDPSSESDMGPISAQIQEEENYKIRKRVRFSRGETDALKEEIAKLHAKLKRSQVLEAGPNVEKGKSPLEFPEAVQQTRENFLHTKDGQDLVAKLVVAAMQELVMMAYEGAPLWIPAKNDGPPNQPYILNKVDI
ncbi:hypothetical protein M0R45_007018 [Rubus argutus]|uniref:Uncharacterized protein n=1 Tax=Rubus argutus TaxID=59490 RepID=A0AAW1YTJ9_RUBAR